jgi:hypothetical protein
MEGTAVMEGMAAMAVAATAVEGVEVMAAGEVAVAVAVEPQHISGLNFSLCDSGNRSMA